VVEGCRKKLMIDAAKYTCCISQRGLIPSSLTSRTCYSDIVCQLPTTSHLLFNSVDHLKLSQQNALHLTNHGPRLNVHMNIFLFDLINPLNSIGIYYLLVTSLDATSARSNAKLTRMEGSYILKKVRYIVHVVS
jgi:hypothetical protein